MTGEFIGEAEAALLAAHRGPVARLVDICETYFGLSPGEAVKAAIRHELPIASFRLRDSQKAPLLVSCHDLARLIDKQRSAAKKDHPARPSG